jgi:hypothetical protein
MTADHTSDTGDFNDMRRTHGVDGVRACFDLSRAHPGQTPIRAITTDAVNSRLNTIRMKMTWTPRGAKATRHSPRVLTRSTSLTMNGQRLITMRSGMAMRRGRQIRSRLRRPRKLRIIRPSRTRILSR